MEIGVLGLGVMGAPIAARLMAAGHGLHVYNRTAAAAANLVERGARAHATPAALAPHVDAAVVMVADGPDVEQVVAGEEGLVYGLRPHALVIDMSTTTPQVERAMAAAVGARGGCYLDAPVSGGDVGARDGTLSIMVGGEAAAVERAKPLLACLGRRITHCGPVGSGQTAKLCNQIMVACNMAGVCEAFALARKQGIDLATLQEAVGSGAGASWQLEHLGPRIARSDWEPGFRIDLLLKDLRAVLATAGVCDAPLPLVSLVSQLFAAARAQGDGRAGHQAVARVFARLAHME